MADTQMILGVLQDKEHANMAVDELEAKGYTAKDISIITREEKHVADESSPASDIAEGTTSGAVTGGVIGGVAGLLIGIGAIALPGIGAVLIGGPLAAALGLTGAAATTVSGAVTGALAGGLVGALVSLGVPEEEAKEYERSIQSGATLIAVPVRENEDEVKDILMEHGATQIRTITTK